MGKARFPIWGLIVPIILLATYLLSTQLTIDAYWHDELFVLSNLGATDRYPDVSYADMLVSVSSLSRNPPLHLFLLSLWANLAGWSELSTRYFSAIASILSIAVMYRLGRDLSSSALGLLAAVLTSTASFFIYYGHETRGYSLYYFFTTFTLWLFWRLLTRRPHRWTQIGFITGSTVMLYIHTAAAPLFAAMASYFLYVGYSRGYTRRWRKVFLDFVVIVLFFLPWLFIAMGTAITTGHKYAYSMTVIQTLEEAFYAFTNGYGWLMLIALVSIVPWMSRKDVVFILYWAIASLALSLFINQFVSFMFHIRYLLPLQIAFIMVIAYALLRLSIIDKRLILFPLLLWIYSGIQGVENTEFMSKLRLQEIPIPRATIDNALEVVACVPESKTETLILYVDASWGMGRINDRVLYYYLGKHLYQYAHLTSMRDISVYPANDFDSPEVADYQKRFQKIMSITDRLWYIRGNDVASNEREDEFLDYVVEHYSQCGQISSYGNVQIAVFSNSQTPLECVEEWEPLITEDTCLTGEHEG